MIETGVCENASCSKAATGEQIERYPGPGEYCPECGSRLMPVKNPPPTANVRIENDHDRR
jgi:DNA-directed RNA polymerase subunit RPC12/RpoP